MCHCVHLQELETVHAERKAAYEAAVGSLESTVSGLESDVTNLNSDLEKSSKELEKVCSRVRELETHITRIGATGAEEHKRRRVVLVEIAAL